MVKRQKEKQYQSAREHKQYAKLRSGSGMTGGTVQRKLPFNCCALTLTPFTTPVCTATATAASQSQTQSGIAIVFDSTALTEFLVTHKKDPVTGLPLTTRDIITLHMDQDEEGRWQCPVLTKPFADHTKVVAILDRKKNEAYVYSYEAYKELNVKSKNWTDLTTGKKFSPKTDVLILNDPQNDEFQKRRDIQTFWHIQNGRSILLEQQASATNVKHSVTATRIMEQIQKEKKRTASTTGTATSTQTQQQPTAKKLKIFADDVTGVRFTSGKASGSLTSTAMDVASDNTIREATPEEILQSQFKVMRSQKQKGYVRIMTNLGDLLVELHCDIAPRTCTNFLGLCQAQKYDGTNFHRLIPNFMIQGGKPKKAGGEDASLWGPAFVDEFDDRLKHTEGGGVVSMANAGPGTNKRQFFITFKAAPHLDRKHSIFGQVVDGMSVLKKMEACASDKKDRPLETITIIKTEILIDPAKDAEELEQKRMEELTQARKEEAERKRAQASGKSLVKTKNKTSSSTTTTSNNVSMIGKYLPKSVLVQQQSKDKDDDDGGDDGGTMVPTLPVPVAKTKVAPPTKTKFGDFSGW